jgi:hypothetical protein
VPPNSLRGSDTRYEVTEHDEYYDGRNRAEIHHPGVGHDPPERLANRLCNPKEHLVQRARLIDREPAHQGPGNDGPNEQLDEKKRELRNVWVNRMTPESRSETRIWLQ